MLNNYKIIQSELEKREKGELSNEITFNQDESKIRFKEKPLSGNNAILKYNNNIIKNGEY